MSARENLLRSIFIRKFIDLDVKIIYLSRAQRKPINFPMQNGVECWSHWPTPACSIQFTGAIHEMRYDWLNVLEKFTRCVSAHVIRKIEDGKYYHENEFIFRCQNSAVMPFMPLSFMTSFARDIHVRPLKRQRADFQLMFAFFLFAGTWVRQCFIRWLLRTQFPLTTVDQFVFHLLVCHWREIFRWTTRASNRRRSTVNKCATASEIFRTKYPMWNRDREYNKEDTQFYFHDWMINVVWKNKQRMATIDRHHFV